jgi:hypothetical protein
MNLSTASLPSTPVTVSSNAPSVLTLWEELLIPDAKARIAHYKQLGKPRAAEIDPAVFLVEEEFGAVMASQGDLSCIMDAPPNLDRLLAPQIHSEIRDEYKLMQASVWDTSTPGIIPPLRTKSGKYAIAIPTHVKGRRYTVTLLTKPSHTTVAN